MAVILFILSVSIINHKSLDRITKWRISCSREKTVQCIFARIKGRGAPTGSMIQPEMEEMVVESIRQTLGHPHQKLQIQ